MSYNLQSALSLVQESSYLLIFILMVFEGPTITIAAAMVASLGFLSVYKIFILALLGDITGDFLFYGLGCSARKNIFEKYGHHVGFHKKRRKYWSKKLNEHFVKSFIFIKNSPIICQPGLILMGSMKIPVRKFFIWSFIITLPKSLLLTAIGYFGGMAILNYLRYFKIAEYFLIFVVLAGVIAYFIIIKKNKKCKKQAG